MDEVEIDFLPVGDGSRSGDAIAMRWVSPDGEKVLVYDGGTQASGEKLVQHIREHYATDHVHYVVNSHPDNDHASGLSVVLEHLTVGQLWMHQPWRYSAHIHQYFADGRMTPASLARRLQDKMAAAHNLEQIAKRRGIPVYEPFAGSWIGGKMLVLAPASAHYVHSLVPDFEKSPELKVSAPATEGLSTIFGKALDVAAAWATEHWGLEVLPEDAKTTAENRSSAVLFGQFGEHGILLTGDAGIATLKAASECARYHGIDLPQQISLLQVPHHGSRHNVSTESLDAILGPRMAADDGRFTKLGVASVGAGSTTHPRRRVVNAFKRRGVRVYETKGNVINKRYGTSTPFRDGYASATPLEFSTEVEV